MRNRRNSIRQLETLESLILLSGAVALTQALPTPAEVSATSTTLTLGGTARGAFAEHQVGSLVIYDNNIKAAGKLAPFGAATITGNLQLLPGILDDGPSGTLHLITTKGTLTLRMPNLSLFSDGSSGPRVPVTTSPYETIVSYDITDGTGAYKGDTGAGIVELTLTPSHSAGSSRTGGATIKFTPFLNDSTTT